MVGCGPTGCSEDEGAAVRELQRAWAQFAGADKKNCVAMTTIGSLASYVELLTVWKWRAMSRTPTRVRAVRKRQMRCDYAPPE